MKPRTTNEEEHGRGRLSGTWSQALLIRAPPCVEEVEVSYLASSRTVVRFVLRIFVLLIFSCFSVVFYFVLECVARHRAALLGSASISFLWYVN